MLSVKCVPAGCHGQPAWKRKACKPHQAAPAPGCSPAAKVGGSTCAPHRSPHPGSVAASRQDLVGLHPDPAHARLCVLWATLTGLSVFLSTKVLGVLLGGDLERGLQSLSSLPLASPILFSEPPISPVAQARLCPVRSRHGGMEVALGQKEQLDSHQLWEGGGGGNRSPQRGNNVGGTARTQAGGRTGSGGRGPDRGSQSQMSQAPPSVPTVTPQGSSGIFPRPFLAFLLPLLLSRILAFPPSCVCRVLRAAMSLSSAKKHNCDRLP